MVVATRESVLRQVNPTKNFALMSFEHQSSEPLPTEHQRVAKEHRANRRKLEESGEKDVALRVTYATHETVGESEPVLFEECYVLAESQELID